LAVQCIMDALYSSAAANGVETAVPA
jgi:hypothetical protein